MELQFRPKQQELAASNSASIVEAYTTLAAGGTALAVGLPFSAMGAFRAARMTRLNYCLRRLMIDRRFQGRRYGKAALEASLRYLADFPCGPAEYIWLSYEPANQQARALYRSMGFTENGQMCGDEIVAVLPVAEARRRAGKKRI